MRVADLARAVLIVGAAVIGALIGACSTPEPAHSPVPPAPHAYRVEQLSRGATTAFVACTECQPRTPKTLASASASARALAVGTPPTAKPQVPAAASVALRTETAIVHFASNSAQLSAAARSHLQALLPLVRQAQRVRVVGYTDDRGDAALNQRLADARALTVMLALRDATSSTAAELTASGRPQCCYVADNSGEPRRAPNRRVEIQIELRPERGDRIGSTAGLDVGERP